METTDNFTVGVYNVSEKKYYSNAFKGAFEIVSLHGTISTMKNDIYLHLHMAAADEKGVTYGGHLNELYVSVTCEMVIDIILGRVDRYHDYKIWLNLFNF